MGDRDANVPITRADLDAQNVRIDNLNDQIREIHDLLQQAVGNNGGVARGNNHRGNDRRPRVQEDDSESEEEVVEPPLDNNLNLQNNRYNRNNFDDYRVKTLQEAINMALMAELMEKEKRPVNYKRNTSNYSNNTIVSSPDKGKSGQQQVGGSSRGVNEGSSPTFNKGQTRTQLQRENPYARPMRDIFYRCQTPGHCSNTCPNRRQANLLESE
ncbi:hypothetical protein LWI29_021064 [Acer saccharum]|uniref:Uncharacterized protein n=1 Tax=Acer saccharum TaxID=4024 RepID=A0AA39SWC6_ACESA|nr:hypothetical protein LWI29_021064 [Acer saccharum]